MIRVHNHSEVGGHAANEDSFAVQSHPQDADCWLCFVADGQGGQRGGGPAARLACETGIAEAAKLSPFKLRDPYTWSEILRRCDQAVQRDSAAGYTTFIGLCVYQGEAVGASSGDSAVLLACNGTTLELTANQTKNPPVGSGAMIATPFAASLASPWQLLAMTDGVWKGVGWNAISEQMKQLTGQMLIDQLRRLAISAGGGSLRDDFTAVVLQPVE
jgi:serine/threonine protein phosphatase PrpC